VKLLVLASFLLVSLSTLPLAFSQIQYYGIDVGLSEEGKAKVKLAVTFVEPEKEFELSLIGRIEKFNASSAGFPINCEVNSGGISYVKCKLNLTQERRTIELNFESYDFVRKIEDKFYFDADFSIGKNVESFFASVKLPEGFALVGEEIKGRLSFPESATILSDGRRHIIAWKLLNVSKDQSLRLQILYERIQAQSRFSEWFFYSGIFLLILVSIIIFVYVKFLRKPEKIILSVLDEFERKVMDAIQQAGGITTQKKVVQATNLSKAKVSRVVKSLVERGLIEVEKLGRTNKLKIVKKKFKIFEK